MMMPRLLVMSNLLPRSTALIGDLMQFAVLDSSNLGNVLNFISTSFKALCFVSILILFFQNKSRSTWVYDFIMSTKEDILEYSAGSNLACSRRGVKFLIVDANPTAHFVGPGSVY